MINWIRNKVHRTVVILKIDRFHGVMWVRTLDIYWALYIIQGNLRVVKESPLEKKKKLYRLEEEKKNAIVPQQLFNTGVPVGALQALLATLDKTPATLSSGMSMLRITIGERGEKKSRCRNGKQTKNSAKLELKIKVWKNMTGLRNVPLTEAEPQ